MKKLLIVTAAACAFVCGMVISTQAALVEITFDEPGISATTPRGFSDPRQNGDTITTQYTTSDGITWINNPSTGLFNPNYVTTGAEFPDAGVPALADGFYSDGNILWAFENVFWIGLDSPSTSVSFDYRRPKQGGSISVNLYNWDGTGSLPAPINAAPYSFNWTADDATYDNWTFCSIDAPPQEFNIISITGNNKFVIDNLSVNMVPIPASFWLLATGLIPLIRRIKK